MEARLNGLTYGELPIARGVDEIALLLDEEIDAVGLEFCVDKRSVLVKFTLYVRDRFANPLERNAVTAANRR